MGDSTGFVKHTGCRMQLAGLDWLSQDARFGMPVGRMWDVGCKSLTRTKLQVHLYTYAATRTTSHIRVESFHNHSLAPFLTVEVTPACDFWSASVKQVCLPKN